MRDRRFRSRITLLLIRLRGEPRRRDNYGYAGAGDGAEMPGQLRERGRNCGCKQGPGSYPATGGAASGRAGFAGGPRPSASDGGELATLLTRAADGTQPLGLAAFDSSAEKQRAAVDVLLRRAHESSERHEGRSLAD